jgi:hypothetical protein
VIDKSWVSGEIFALRNCLKVIGTAEQLAAGGDADSYRILELEGGDQIEWKSSPIQSLQDVSTWHLTVDEKRPTLETSVIMVHCDRFIESDTRGQYRSEQRLDI